MVTPAARRQAVAHAMESFGVSQRRVCDAIGVDRIRCGTGIEDRMTLQFTTPCA
jgi:hypothetical protein